MEKTNYLITMKILEKEINRPKRIQFVQKSPPIEQEGYKKGQFQVKDQTFFFQLGWVML